MEPGKKNVRESVRTYREKHDGDDPSLPWIPGTAKGTLSLTNCLVKNATTGVPDRPPEIVYCAFEDPAGEFCSWEGRYSDYREHVKTCPVREQMYGCKET